MSASIKTKSNDPGPFSSNSCFNVSVAGPIFNVIFSWTPAFFHKSCRIYWSLISHAINWPSDGRANAIVNDV